GYNVSITQEDDFRIVSVNGFVLSGSQINSNRTVEAVLQVTNASQSPESFYDNALYTSGNISASGDTYNVTGDLLLAGEFSDEEGEFDDNIDGEVTQDPSTWPFAEFNFTVLKATSIAQGNYHDNISLDGPFPVDFWYNESAGIPNVVYMEGDLDLSGQDHVGGVYILEGGEAFYDATLRGNAQIDGVVYCQSFTLRGGGHEININGGIWAEEITLSGNSKITYNATFMNATEEYFEEIGSPPLQQMPTNATIISWRDMQNPYVVE
ncbi:MAG: hypothetical protein KKC84_06320, partial [Candidatus Omnitrophica bacterium]|nr:hypothetical protein [Candidatus Omnitrophota bacterium]